MDSRLAFFSAFSGEIKTRFHARAVRCVCVSSIKSVRVASRGCFLRVSIMSRLGVPLAPSIKIHAHTVFPEPIYLGSIARLSWIDRSIDPNWSARWLVSIFLISIFPNVFPDHPARLGQGKNTKLWHLIVDILILLGSVDRNIEIFNMEYVQNAWQLTQNPSAISQTTA